jgi:hypothetical protein
MLIYAGKGAVHFLLSEFRASIEAHQGLLEVARQLGDRNKETEALHQIGFSFLFAHEFEQALGALYESQTDLERARVAYQSAMDVINGVAEQLQDQELQRTFLAARPVQEIRERLAQVGRGRH